MPTGISGDTGVDQVTLAALAAKFSASGMQSLTTNGYQKLPGGLILQWGITASIPQDSTLTVNFPISFPNTVLNVNITGQGNSVATTGAGEDTVGAFNSNQFVIYHGQDGNRPFYWFAVGY